MHKPNLFELQLKFNTGWQTIDDDLTSETAGYALLHARRRWPRLKVRLRHNGRTIKGITWENAWPGAVSTHEFRA